MITDIRLQNFRSYKDSAFELDKSVNIIVGPNASGKTNLLEAILMLSVGKSYRATTEEMIRFGVKWARLETHTKDGSRVAKLQDQASGGKTFEVDQQTYKRLPASKKLPIVLFEPQHLSILSGRPELRRDYLDDIIEQINPGFGRTRRDYKRALAQRNTLLKSEASVSKQQIFAWNIRLSELGGNIVSARRQLIDELKKPFTKIYKALSASQTKTELYYSSPLSEQNYVSSLLHHLEKNLQIDQQRGFTSFGPHREDLMVQIGGKPVQEVASRGEIRTMVLALKILEMSILEEVNDQKPIILLDDVFSELDGSRRRALTQYLNNYQTFITTTDADLIVHDFAQRCHIITVKSG